MKAVITVVGHDAKGIIAKVSAACAEMGVQISAFEIMGSLFYPYLLLVSSLIAIFLIKEKK